MKKLNILIYTDTIGLEDEKDPYCIGDLRRFIRLKLGDILDVETSVRVRHFDYQTKKLRHAATKLTGELLKEYHELWVFGFGIEENTDAEPAFLLTKEEVDDLCEWMKVGGVMVTGDHSYLGENNEVCTTPNHEEFRSMGYSLGSKLPRAGQMRVWKGPPTNCLVPQTQLGDSDTHNTQVPGDCSDDLDQRCLQSDARPQELEPRPGPPHFLFFYDLDAQGRRVAVTQLPDHMHEGRVTVPAKLEGCWPEGSPTPEIVARGRDKRFTAEERIYELVAAYDGDRAGVGRIVADSSFHHFLNINIGGPPSKDVGIPERDALGNPKPGSPLDKIAQFYANLAYWLAPKPLREEVKRELFFRAARHIDVLETVGNGTLQLGRVAKAALESLLGTANVLRVIEAVGGEGDEGLVDYALTGKGGHEGFHPLAHEYLLGSVVESYYDFFRAKGLSPLRVTEDVVPPEVPAEAVSRAFFAHASRAEELVARFGARAPRPDGGGDTQEGAREDGGGGD